jgi:type III secretory pathway component EscS
MRQRLRPVPVIVVALVVGLIVDVLTGYSPFPGYGAALGLLGCSVIIIASKWLGTALLQRAEDYYPEDVPADIQEDLRG